MVTVLVHQKVAQSGALSKVSTHTPALVSQAPSDYFQETSPQGLVTKHTLDTIHQQCSKLEPGSYRQDPPMEYAHQ
jgi:hypothetical protein